MIEVFYAVFKMPKKIEIEKVVTIHHPTKRQMMKLILNVVGEGGVLVAEYLYKKKDISEFEISKKLKIEVNAARSLLYKLFNHNLVTYIRRKDKVKGWYISYWTLNPKGFNELEIKLKKLKQTQLSERLVREEKNPNGFFMCRNACIRLDFDQATDYGFRCPECGELLNPQDNSKTIENLKSRLKELEVG